MTCNHCCGANKLFDEKTAKKDLKKYLKKGPQKSSKLLIEALKKKELSNLSLLDIGGGIGSIPLELIPTGITKVTDVDASEGYIKIAQQEAGKRGLLNLITYHQGDFVDVHSTINQHDIVTLDKVICCYPNVEELLKTSLSKSNKYFGLVYPQVSILSKLVIKIGNLYLKITGSCFRTYLHNSKYVNDLITSSKFKKVYSEKSFPWQIHLYQKE